MTKILQIVSSISIDSGVMSVVMNYYRNIDRSKIQFDFLYYKEVDESYKKEIKMLGGNIYKIDNSSILNFFQTINNFFKLKTNKYNAIHIHPIWAPALFNVYFKKYNIKNIIIHSHTTKYSDKTTSSLRNAILVKFYPKKINYIIGCSNEALSLFDNISADNKIVIPNGISIKDFKFSLAKRNELRNKMNIDENSIVLINIGRLVKQKNQKFILEVFKEISKINMNYKLIIIGNGPLESKLKKYASKLNVKEKVYFIDKNNAIGDYLSASDILFFPSIFEGFGLVCLEAQASGLPCIVSEEIPDFVKIKNCNTIFLDQNTNEWAKKILETMIISSEERKRAYKPIENSNFNLNVITKKIENIYLNFDKNEK